jgi:outer membrane PBP1 activator LpoA protein
MPLTAHRRNTGAQETVMKRMASLVLIAFLCACSPTQDQTPKVADDQRKALDEAKSLDSTLQRSAEEQARDTEAQSR